jgi:hypothetical protein
MREKRQALIINALTFLEEQENFAYQPIVSLDLGLPNTSPLIVLLSHGRCGEADMITFE